MTETVMTGAAPTASKGLTRQRWRSPVALALGVLGFSFLLVEPAAAQDPAALLENVLNLLTSGVTRTLAVIAVIILGICAVFGIFDWRRVGMVVFGIVVIFGAAGFVDLIAT